MENRYCTCGVCGRIPCEDEMSGEDCFNEVKLKGTKELYKKAILDCACYKTNKSVSLPDIFKPRELTIEDLEKKIQALTEELESLKAQDKKYEPMPGNFNVTGHGDISTAGSFGKYLEFGRAFDTKEKAEKARDIMKTHDIILKYVIDHAPDYEPDWTDCEEKWSVSFDYYNKRWTIENTYLKKCIGEIYMPRWVAEQLEDDLNNNRIDGIESNGSD